MSQARFLPYVVSATLFMELLDANVVITALPAMATTFKTGPNELSLVVTSYVLTLATLVPVSGWITDKIGTRTIFMSATIIFTLSSAFCGLSENTEFFIICRILQGAAGAMMNPVGRYIVLSNTEKSRTIQAITSIAWPAITAPVIGPALGGFIVTYTSWRWIFYINVPIGLVILAVIWALVPQQHGEDRPFDWGGFFLSAATVICILLGTELASEQTVGLMWSGILVTLGVILLVFTYFHSKSQIHPLLNLSLLQLRTFRFSIIVGGISRLCIQSQPYLLPLLFQLGFGLSAYQAGLLLLVFAFGNLITKAVTTYTLKQYGFKCVSSVTSVLCVIFMLLCAFLNPELPIWLIMCIIFGCGITRSMQFSALNALSYAEINDKDKSQANMLVTINQQVTMALGVALASLSLHFASIFQSEAQHQTSFNTNVFRWAFIFMAIPMLITIPAYFRLPSNIGSDILGKN